MTTLNFHCVWQPCFLYQCFFCLFLYLQHYIIAKLAPNLAYFNLSKKYDLRGFPNLMVHWYNSLLYTAVQPSKSYKSPLKHPIQAHVTQISAVANVLFQILLNSDVKIDTFQLRMEWHSQRLPNASSNANKDSLPWFLSFQSSVNLQGGCWDVYIPLFYWYPCTKFRLL